MKNKKLVLTALILLSAFPLCAGNLQFSFEPEFGGIYGTIFENVWYADSVFTQSTITTTPTARESQLDWQLQNVFYTGAAVNLTFSEHYSFDFDFKTAFPGLAGIMEDFDWLNPIYWPSDPIDQITNYSIHLMYLDNFTKTRFCFGYTFILNQKLNFSITPKIGIEAQSFYFLGKSGYSLYKSNGWAKEYFTAGATVITYSQAFTAPLAGLSLKLDFAKYFETDLSFLVTYINKYDAYDDHFERHDSGKTCYFNDKLQDVFIFDSSIKLFWKINEHNKLGLKGSVNISPKAYGYTYSSKTSFEELSDQPSMSDLGGSSRLLFTYALVYQFYF